MLWLHCSRIVIHQRLGDLANLESVWTDLRNRRHFSSRAGEEALFEAFQFFRHVRPNAFARLLSNVIGNAFRYARTVEINADHRGGSLLVTIDDDGPGIPPEKREEVFKPFLRLDEARNLDASGTGLGLSIARDIARSHVAYCSAFKSTCVKHESLSVRVNQ